MLANRLCIDVGTSRIKLVLGKTCLGRTVIIRCGTIDTPQGAFSNGYIYDTEVIAEKIKRYITENGYKATNASFVVHSSDILIRNIKLPIMSKNNIYKSIQWEVGQYIKGSLNEYYIGYDTTEKNGNVINILAVIVPKTIIEQYETLSLLIGLSLKRVEVAAISVKRVFNKLSRAHTYAILDIGFETVRISLYEHNCIFADRELQCKAYDSLSIDQQMNIVFKSLAQIVEYYLSLDSANQLNRVYLIGGNAENPIIRECINKVNLISYGVADDFINIKSNNEFERSKGLYANATGMLLW